MAKIVVEVVGKDAGATAVFNKTNDAAAKLGATAAKTSATLGGSVVKGTDRATLALSNFGRVASDAPFGVIAIQNNIGPLIESFQQLRTQTGSTGAALKALGSSLLGSGGLLVGVQLLSAAMTILAQNPEKVAAAFDYLAGVTDDTTDSIQAYNKALIESEADARGEIASINALVAVAGNQELSYNARKEAVDKLNESSKSFNDQLTVENINTDKSRKLIDSVTQSILNQAKAKAVQDLITQAYARKLEAENKGLQTQASNLSKVGAIISKVIGLGGTGADILNRSGFEQSTEAIKGANDELTNLQKLLTGIYTDEAKAGTLFNDGKAKESLNDLLKQLREFKAEFYLTFGPISAELATQGIDNLTTQLKDKYKKAADELGKQPPLIPLPNLNQGEYNKYYEEFIISAEAFTVKVNEILKSGIQSGISDFASNIGSALANGENLFQAFGSSVLSTIGDVLVQFGKLTIAAGIASSALASALSNPLNPLSGFAAIAAGAALVAVGALVKGFAANVSSGSSDTGSGGNRRRIPGFAGGVTNFEGGLAYVHAGEMLTNLPTGTNVVTKANTDRLLGGGGVTLSGELKVSMRTLYLELQREGKLIDRIG